MRLLGISQTIHFASRTNWQDAQIEKSLFNFNEDDAPKYVHFNTDDAEIVDDNDTQVFYVNGKLARKVSQNKSRTVTYTDYFDENGIFVRSKVAGKDGHIIITDFDNEGHRTAISEFFPNSLRNFTAFDKDGNVTKSATFYLGNLTIREYKDGELVETKTKSLNI